MLIVTGLSDCVPYSEAAETEKDQDKEGHFDFTVLISSVLPAGLKQFPALSNFILKTNNLNLPSVQ